MTLTSSITLLGSMIVLALMPGPGILAVVGRTLAAGLRQGVSTVAGIVVGDFVFITLALFGLAALSELMGGLFSVVRYLGAGYLVWLGISIILSKGGPVQPHTSGESSHLASFMAGLLITLSNPKAILFYLSFLPAFLDLSQVSVVDAGILYFIAAVAVGGVMYAYAYAAHKAKSSLQVTRGGRVLRYGSGALLIGCAIFVAARG